MTNRQAIENIEQRYESVLQNKVDQSHLSILKTYGEKCKRIVEVGFRAGVSASAFIAALPEKFTSVDWDKHPFRVDREILDQINTLCKDANIDFSFVAADILEIEIPACDLLFLDGFHTYEHVLLELIKHQNFVEKYILLHDTEEPTCPGVFNAVEDFLLDNKQWELEKRHYERPGLTILKRVNFENPFEYSVVLKQTLEHEANRQKQMYYDQISGTQPSIWDQYVYESRLRYADHERWPLTNRPLSATDLMDEYLSRQKEN